MSAIWGMIAKDTSIPETTVSAMQNSMRNFKIDRYHSIVRGSAYVACGLQYFTKTSYAEMYEVNESLEKDYDDLRLDYNDLVDKYNDLEEELYKLKTTRTRDEYIASKVKEFMLNKEI